MRASSYLKRLYNHYNSEHFQNKLPKDVRLYYAPKLDKVKTEKGKKRSTCAVTYFYKKHSPVIVIRRTKAKSMRHIVSDLLHEMCHISAPESSCDSGTGKFQEEMKRLAAEGAFYNVW